MPSLDDVLVWLAGAREQLSRESVFLADLQGRFKLSPEAVVELVGELLDAGYVNVAYPTTSPPTMSMSVRGFMRYREL